MLLGKEEKNIILPEILENEGIKYRRTEGVLPGNKGSTKFRMKLREKNSRTT